MASFKEMAQKAIGGSDLLVDKKKMTIKTLLESYPNGVTLTGFDIIDGKKGAYAVFTIKEDAGVYFNGGSILTKIALSWVEGFNGDITGANAKLLEGGGFPVKLSRSTTRDGNEFTAVTLL